MSAFDDMAAAGNPLGVAMQIPDLMMTLAEALDGATATEAAADAELLKVWSDAAPESRTAILISYAWGTRGKPHILTTDTARPAALGYVSDLYEYANAAGDDIEAFHGAGFPMPPYPGQAGALASSLAFDRDDLAISLEAALILLATGHGEVRADG